MFWQKIHLIGDNSYTYNLWRVTVQNMREFLNTFLSTKITARNIKTQLGGNGGSIKGETMCADGSVWRNFTEKGVNK